VQIIFTKQNILHTACRNKLSFQNGFN